MRNIFLSLILLFGQTFACAQTNVLPRTTPESQGIHSETIITMFDSLMSLPQTDIHSIMIVKNGYVIAEMYPRPFTSSSMHTLYSCSKTFLGAAIGIAIEENRLRLTDRITTLLPEYLPDTISDNLANIKVKDLLTMTSGIEPDWDIRNECSNWIQVYLNKKVGKPGTKFQYDSICSYLLSAIIQKVTGQKLIDYLKEKVFIPLGISNVDWEESPEGYNTGGWGLRLQTESMTKFGMLLMNKGNWNGKQLIPSSWVEQMTAKQMEAGDEDYCYQMWQCDYPGAIRADGAYGQYIIIVPQKNIVVSVTQCSLINGMIPRHIIWNNLLAKSTDTPLKKNEFSDKLKKRQEEYSLPLIRGKKNSQLYRQLNNKEYILEKNEFDWKLLKFTKENNRFYLTIVNKENNEAQYNLQYNEWDESMIHTFPPYSVRATGRFKGIHGPFRAAANYAWNNDNLNIQIHYIDWISALHLSISDISEKRIRITVRKNYSSQISSINAVSR